MRESSAFKDLFSKQAIDYARFRPTYPDDLFEFLSLRVAGHSLAWDCATGNGQAAAKLARCFDRVIATDPSDRQLESAVPHPRVEYRAGSAEASSLDPASVDLITVAQAFHWFRQDEFFAEAKRVLKPGGVVAFWCYGLARITPEVDAVVHKLYDGILGPYWEKERRLVDEGYRGVALPFPEIDAPPFGMSASWSLEHLIGYLGTWSALQAYLRKNGENPLEKLYPELKKAWGGAESLPVSWELALRVGRLE